MSSTKSSQNSLSSITPERHRKGSLSIHPYFGKLDPALARTLIEQFSKPGDIVLDPFCGSGTVLHEAILSGRSAIGWDSSPLALLIATAKLQGIYESERKELSLIEEELDNFSSDRLPLFKKEIPGINKVPDMPRVREVNFWFGENALRELSFLKSFLAKREEVLSVPASILATVSFSRIIVASSNQQGESSYRRINKDDYPGRVIDLYQKALANTIRGAEKFKLDIEKKMPEIKRSLLLKDEKSSYLKWSSQKASIYLKDTRDFSISCQNGKDKAQIVVSSPPYLMSWDYGLYHKFRFYWLGFDLDAYEETEIGRHLRRKKDDIPCYIQAMTGAFLSMNEALDDDASILLVNAPSIVYGKEVDTNELLKECASSAGWIMTDCIKTLDIPGPHHGMYASLSSRNANAPGKSGKKEHVLMFKKDVR